MGIRRIADFVIAWSAPSSTSDYFPSSAYTAAIAFLEFSFV
jgi:hypothetical protein